MMARSGIITMALALLLGSGACASGSGMRGGSSALDERVTVEVQNQNWSNMVVYLVQGGIRTRLGLVNALSSERFPVPRTAIGAAGRVQLYADPIGSDRGYASDVLYLRPGQHVALSVGHNLRMSFVSVRN